MKQTITYFLLFIAINGCSQNGQTAKEDHANNPVPNPASGTGQTHTGEPVINNTLQDTVKHKLTYRVFENDSLLSGISGWGYDIFLDGNHYIRQEHIPAIPGNKGFDRKDDAEKAVLLIIKKIEQGIMPPSVSPEELDSLGIIYFKRKE